MTVLHAHAVINCRWLWKTWKDYLHAFGTIGGVLEAAPLHISSSPSVNLCVEPDGYVSIKSAHEQIFSSPFTFVGAAFPQTAVPFAALREASLAVGRACYANGLIGHMGVDFVSFIDSTGQLRLWAIDLNLRLTHTAVTFGFFDFLVGGHFDITNGRYAPLLVTSLGLPSHPLTALGATWHQVRDEADGRLGAAAARLCDERDALPQAGARLPISRPLYLARHISPAISRPPYLARHISPVISRRLYLARHISPVISRPPYLAPKMCLSIHPALITAPHAARTPLRPQLAAMHHSAFFNLCRLKGVSFDLQVRRLRRSPTISDDPRSDVLPMCSHVLLSPSLTVSDRL